MKFLNLILLFLGITLSNVGEFQANRLDSHFEKVQNTSQDMATAECSDHSSHCRHHCSAIHHILLDEKNAFIISPLSFELISFNKYILIYQKPNIDPALKPPRLS